MKLTFFKYHNFINTENVSGKLKTAFNFLAAFQPLKLIKETEQFKKSSLKDNLKTLIAYCEEEKGRLINLINECLKEKEYEFAHFHQQALYHLNGQLHTFLRFDDCHFDEKQRTKNQIAFLEKQIALVMEHSQNAPIIEWQEHLKSQRSKQREKLENLIALPKHEISTDEATFLQTTINNLLEKKIKGFRLELVKKDKFLLDFSYSKKSLKLVLPNIRRLSDKWILEEDIIQTLMLYGFQFVNNGKKLELNLRGDNQSIIFKLNIILSKMIFELFRTVEFKNESFIIIRRKASC